MAEYQVQTHLQHLTGEKIPFFLAWLNIRCRHQFHCSQQRSFDKVMEWVDKVDWNSWYICLFHCWFQGLSFNLAIEQHNEVKDTVLDVTYDELMRLPAH